MMEGGTANHDATTTHTNNNNNSNNSEPELQDQTTTFTSSWGTWEELLLACAVKRHGINDWNSVAMELQAKTSLPHLLTTAYNCKLKYHDLRRRFKSRYSSQHQNDDVALPSPPPPPDHHDDPPSIPWLDDLRKLRVAQLRQELNRYDVSIVSLQLKVKRLEEEREDSSKDDEAKPDLEEEDSKGHRSENDKNIQDEPDRSKPDQENQSVNGSNSTCSKSLDNKPGQEGRVASEPEPHPVPDGSREPMKEAGGHSESESDKGSSETVAKKRSREGKGGGDSAGEMRESSEAQSSASLTRKWNRKRRRRVEVPEHQRNNEELLLVKSQPLVGVLQMIRAHEHSSLFERRLPTQVFGASNVSRLLAHIPLSDRCKAAMSISYEAQARVQDPIYGCVSHIFALQQQVVNLQAQLAFLKDQAAQSFVNGSVVANPNPVAESFVNGSVVANPNPAAQSFVNGSVVANPNQAAQSWNNENGIMNSNNSVTGSYENSVNIPEENVSYGSFEEGTSHSMSSFGMQTNYNRQWGFQDADELQAVVSSNIVRTSLTTTPAIVTVAALVTETRMNSVNTCSKRASLSV